MDKLWGKKNKLWEASGAFDLWSSRQLCRGSSARNVNRRACGQAADQIPKAVMRRYTILLGMSLRHLSFLVLVVLVFSVCRGSPVACSAVDEETPLCTPDTGCHESQGCASSLQAPRIWDIPMPSLHEKLYRAHHDERLPPVAHSDSSAPLSFAYITASSWPRRGSDIS
jgi:hypothetical protein